jgi:hypothetical protein
MTNHDEHASENGDPTEHGEESSPSSTTLWPPFSLLIAVTFSTPTPDFNNHSRATTTQTACFTAQRGWS